MKGLLTLEGMTRGSLELLLAKGEQYSGHSTGSAVPRTELQGQTVATMFFEPSTRTRLSFEKAAQDLGGNVMRFDPEGSSSSKGESLKDTALTLSAMGADVLVVRHPDDQAPMNVAGWTERPVVNGGAGRGEHPTQTLLDALTMRKHFGSMDGLRIAIVGDVRNSRVARGHMLAFPRLGAHLTLVGPPGLLPESVPTGIDVSTDMDDVLASTDVIYLLRLQKERGTVTGFASDDEYAARYGMDDRRQHAMRDEAMIMHPGPINRGIEISDAVADGKRSLILEQVANGVPMRMAVLAAVAER